MKCENYKLGEYLSSNDESRWATIREIQNSGHYIRLSDENYVGDDRYQAGGLPLISNGKEAYVDNQDTHSLIFGATGSKKTRLFCMPLINIFAKAGESFIATDPKGELYQKTSGLVSSMGYKIVLLDFRNIGFGDMWNPLALPYEIYHSKDKELGISMLNDFISSIASPLAANSEDVFWIEMAKSFALANLLLLMESADPDEVNVSSLARMCSPDSEPTLYRLSQMMKDESLASINYRGVFSGAEGTKRSIYAMLYSMVRVFNTQQNLSKMLCLLQAELPFYKGQML